MSKYYIIPEEAIEEKINNLEKLFKDKANPFNSLLIDLLSKGKEIDLSDEAIKEKAEETYELGREIFHEYPNDIGSYIIAVAEGYKKAIKDLKEKL